MPYWTEANPTNNYARLFSSNGSASYSVYRKGSFIRLSTVALGYNFPKTLLQKAKIEGLKVYANVNNAAIYQPDWTFWDSEYGNNPPPRYISFGLNLTL
jgi:hypothetical protein